MTPPVVPSADISSHRQILKATAIIGSSRLFQIGIAAARGKALAMILGPSGMGYIAILTSGTELLRSVSAFGIDSAGVKIIAEANSGNDEERMARTAYVLRRTSLACGCLGALFALILSPYISIMSFGHSGAALPISALGLTILLNSVSGGQLALLQGKRLLKDLALSSAFGAALGAVTSVSLIFVFGSSGIVPALIAAAAIATTVSWHFSRHHSNRGIHLPFRQLIHEAAKLLKLGSAFLVGTVLGALSPWLIRIFISQHYGAAGPYHVGLFAAVSTISSIYIATILQAMGADFLPRLSGAKGDSKAIREMTNHQTESGILLATPGVLFTIALAPLILSILYSSEFAPASDVIRWYLLGVALRVVAWPLGFVLLTTAHTSRFVAANIIGALMELITSYFFLNLWGLKGVGIASVATWGLNLLIVLPYLRRFDFYWSPRVWKWGCGAVVAVVATLSCVKLEDRTVGTSLGLLLSAGYSFWALHQLKQITGLDAVSFVRKTFGISRFFSRKTPDTQSATGKKRD